jgi:hypothetical protein
VVALAKDDLAWLQQEHRELLHEVGKDTFVEAAEQADLSELFK